MTLHILFKFILPPILKEFYSLDNTSIIKEINKERIYRKNRHLLSLKSERIYERIADQLTDPILNHKIKVFRQQIETKICSNLPTAFWHRHRHIAQLPYEKNFNKQAELEWGVPRLVINYKPLNKALQWIRYLIPNKKDLLDRLHEATIFSKFDIVGPCALPIHPITNWWRMRGYKSFIAFDHRPSPLVLEWIVKSLTIPPSQCGSNNSNLWSGSDTTCRTVCLTDPSNDQLVKDEGAQIFYSIRS